MDNDWKVNESLPKEPDHEGNINNYITHDDLVPLVAAISTVAPGSTTLGLAGQQPIESKEKEEVPTPSDLPGGFPATPATELDQPISINPLPAADGAINPVKLAPGEEVPKDLKTQNLNDNVRLDKESYEKSDTLPAATGLDQTVSVNPLPAADGAINPIKLAPGEEVPKGLKTQNINENVRLDKESYEKSDTLAGIDMDLPPASETTIPEIGFAIPKDKPVEDATISTVGVGATTLGLAGLVPKEPKKDEVPKIVKESQEVADAPPEASAVPQEVAEKAKVEDELKEKVPEVPATSTGTEKTTETSTIAATVAAAGGALASAAIIAKETLTERATPALQQATEIANKNLPDTVKEKLPVSVQEALAGTTKTDEEVREELAPEIPEEVKKSIIEANKEPEAAANTLAVEEKKEVEKELLAEVKKVPAEGETKGEDIKQDTAAPVETVPANGKEPVVAETKDEAPANGSNGHGNGHGNGAGAAASSSSSKPTTAAEAKEAKKKHRISGFFSKLKHKITD